MAESYDGILDFLKSVIPAHTIVGSAIRGDVTGAASRTAKLATSAGAVQPYQPGVSSSGGLQPIPTSGMAGWILPALGIGVVLLLFLGREKRRYS